MTDNDLRCFYGYETLGKEENLGIRKRQITIPIDFYKAVGIEDEVDCYLQDDAIIIRPAQELSGAFDEQILAE